MPVQDTNLFSPSSYYSLGSTNQRIDNIYLTPKAASQATSITTAVTLNGTSGVITTQTATTASGGNTTFTVNNSEVTANSAVLAEIIHYSGTYTTNGLPGINVESVAAGSFQLIITNPHGANALNGTLQIAFFIC